MTWHHIPTVQVPQLKICLLLSAYKTISYSSHVIFNLPPRNTALFTNDNVLLSTQFMWLPSFTFIKVKCTDVFHQEHCFHTQISWNQATGVYVVNIGRWIWQLIQHKKKNSWETTLCCGANIHVTNFASDVIWCIILV